MIAAKYAKNATGTVTGISRTCFALGQAIGPLVSGLIWSWSISSPFLVLAAIQLSQIVLMMVTCCVEHTTDILRGHANPFVARPCRAEGARTRLPEQRPGRATPTGHASKHGIGASDAHVPCPSSAQRSCHEDDICVAHPSAIACSTPL
eukprot:scaffold104105_cov66-Phaeocystis_antarctica.AAC.3